VVLKIKGFDIESGKEIALGEEEAEERKVILKPNSSTEITTVSIPNADQTVIAAYLSDPSTGHQLARWVDWPEPLKYVRFSKSTKVETVFDGQDVVLKSNVPVKGVMVGVKIEEGQDARWEDNYVDLVPGEEVKVGVEGLGGRDVEVRWLGDWELREGEGGGLL